MIFADKYELVAVPYREAQEIVVRNHYLHRKAPMSQAWGLLDIEQHVITALVVYGTPSSSTLRSGIAGEEHSKNVLELTRLWVAPGMPRNTASFLVGNTLRRCHKEYIVSFADASVGHVGYVYQATNWLYTGLSAKRTDWKLEGYEGHSQTLSDKYSAAELREMYGDKFKLVPRPRKHRYVFVNAKGKRRKELIEAIRYKLLPYPKGESSHAEELPTAELVYVKYKPAA